MVRVKYYVISHKTGREPIVVDEADTIEEADALMAGHLMNIGSDEREVLYVTDNKPS